MSAVSHSDFDDLMSSLGGFGKGDAIGLALSGGPDSMALGFLLTYWAQKHDVQVHGVTVDHGLRAESAQEAKDVQGWTKDWPNFTHHIVRWDGDKPDTRIMEEARKARYALMSGVFQSVSVHNVFVAHHLDDQAETFLIRLSKGSGLDGLSGMRAQQVYEQDGTYPLTFLRPFLATEKQRLIETCEEFNVPYVQDPSNEKNEYLRPRLRAARDVLESEGLSNKRLAATARRLEKARSALEEITDTVYGQFVTHDGAGVRIDANVFREWPEEIGLRVFMKAMKSFQRAQSYGPRLEKMETLYGKIYAGHDTIKETLGGCIIEYQPEASVLTIQPEQVKE